MCDTADFFFFPTPSLNPHSASMLYTCTARVGVCSINLLKIIAKFKMNNELSGRDGDCADKKKLKKN